MRVVRMPVISAFFLCFVLRVFGAAPAVSEEPRPSGGDGLRVFVMGHSFHIFVADRLGPLARSAGISGHVLLGRQMIGGSSVRQHWDLPDGRNQAKEALAGGTVDVLTMSPNWMVPDDGIQLFSELGLRHNPSLSVLLQISWMAFDHWEPRNPERWDPSRKVHQNRERDTRTLDSLREANAAITAVIEQQVTQINRARGGPLIRVVPVNEAVLRLRELIVTGGVPGISRQSELFTDPIGHGTAPVRALATYCNFACLYGRSPVGLDDGDRTLDGIHPNLRPFLQKIAWDSVTDCPLSGVTKEGFRKAVERAPSVK